MSLRIRLWASRARGWEMTGEKMASMEDWLSVQIVAPDASLPPSHVSSSVRASTSAINSAVKTSEWGSRGMLCS